MDDPAHERRRRNTLITRYLNYPDGTNLYAVPAAAMQAVKDAWLDSNGTHLITSVSVAMAARERCGDVAALPSFFGSGRYLAVIQTEGMGKFTGMCEKLNESHHALVDALAAYIEDIQRVRK